ncbi:MAG TPA: efflux transporter outer membrane subunit [Casimicrobiaceae bacterium]|nr:efflux transporter outer membrane subunit [Casimicrobiaceae bacterium]
MPSLLSLRSARRTVGGVLTTAAMLAACTVGPDYVRPPVDAPAAFKEQWKVAQPRDEGPRGNWWEVFGIPELNALVAQVDINNQNIKVAEANVRQAQALTAQARSAFFPTVTGSASATRGSVSGGARSGSASTGSGSGGGGVGNAYSVALDANWELDLWGRVRRNVESAEASARASEADLAGAKLSAQAQLVQDYLLLRVQDAQIKLLSDTVEAYARSLQLTRNQYAVGVAGRSDVALAETQLNSTQAQAIDAGVQRAQLEHAIALLIGKPPAEVSIAPEPVERKFPDIPPGVPSELLERRPDIAAAERRVAAANAQIGVAQAAFYPTLTLSAAGGFASSSFANLLSTPARFWSLGAALAQTIFDAGLRQSQTEQAIAAYDATVATYRQTVLTGFQEVEDNLAALRILEQEAAVQDDAVKGARESLAITLNQYRAGTANYLAVIVVQAQALANERTAVSILGQRLNASVALIKALGGGWKETPAAGGNDGSPRQG